MPTDIAEKIDRTNEYPDVKYTLAAARYAIEPIETSIHPVIMTRVSPADAVKRKQAAMLICVQLLMVRNE
jgi:hypothetical protein